MEYNIDRQAAIKIAASHNLVDWQYLNKSDFTKEVITIALQQDIENLAYIPVSLRTVDVLLPFVPKLAQDMERRSSLIRDATLPPEISKEISKIRYPED